MTQDVASIKSKAATKADIDLLFKRCEQAETAATARDTDLRSRLEKIQTQVQQFAAETPEVSAMAEIKEKMRELQVENDLLKQRMETVKTAQDTAMDTDTNTEFGYAVTLVATRVGCPEDKSGFDNFFRLLFTEELKIPEDSFTIVRTMRLAYHDGEAMVKCELASNKERNNILKHKAMLARSDIPGVRRIFLRSSQPQEVRNMVATATGILRACGAQDKFKVLDNGRIVPRSRGRAHQLGSTHAPSSLGSMRSPSSHQPQQSQTSAPTGQWAAGPPDNSRGGKGGRGSHYRGRGAVVRGAATQRGHFSPSKAGIGYKKLMD